MKENSEIYEVWWHEEERSDWLCVYVNEGYINCDGSPDVDTCVVGWTPTPPVVLMRKEKPNA